MLSLCDVPLTTLASDPRVGTPSYVYDLDGIRQEALDLRAGFNGAPHLVAYAVKANSAGPILKTLLDAGCGADVVSGGELVLALRCGVAPDHILFSGVAKSDDELDRAITAGPLGIGAIQLESVEELARVEARAAAHGRIARVSLRINPELERDALATHDYIATGHDEAKFGIPLASVGDALAVFGQNASLRLVGVGAHVGSQLTSTDGYLASARAVFALARDVRDRFPLSFVGGGGGFGIDYGDGCPVRPADFIVAIRRLQSEFGLDAMPFYCEPGRSLVGAHGVLVARVVQRKIAGTRRWTMIDAGMNDLMRPALYQARHRIVPLMLDATTSTIEERVVGPVCESSDDFGIHAMPRGAFDHVAILDAGAYGYSMASRYNGRALPAEVFLRNGAIASLTERRPTQDWVDDRLGACP
jgi:diaminopimelate decarboxylase